MSVKSNFLLPKIANCEYLFGVPIAPKVLFNIKTAG